MPRRPIQIAGRRFASIAEAADYYGVGRAAIIKARDQGRLERAAALWEKGLSMRNPRWIEIDGALYTHIDAAAYDCDVSRSTIYRWIDTNRAKRIKGEPK